MKSVSLGLSLRSKLIFVLTAVPVVVLAFYLVMASKLFERDKIAYVYDSSVSLTSAIATQFRVEIESLTEKVKFYSENYNLADGQFNDAAKASFASQDRILALVIQPSKSEESAKAGSLYSDNQGRELYKQAELYTKEIRSKSQLKSIVVRVLKETGKHLVIGYFIPVGTDKKTVMISLVVEAERLFANIKESKVFNHTVATFEGDTLIGSNKIAELGIDDTLFATILEPVKNKSSLRGTKEVKTKENKYLLVSYNELGVGDLVLLSIVKKDLALEAVNLLIAKSLIFFVALVCITVIISLIASVRLTSTLRELVEATQLMAKGQFGKRVVKRSDDEVGSLAESFNIMATEVSRLLDETADKAKLENELATVQTVQETLFPEENVNFGPITISGHYEPASGCGGDWWSYSLIGDRVWLWIGDATGHGASAALITSAAKAVSSVLETMPDISPGSAMEILNQAIYDTSKGKMMMTFFIGAIDLATGELTYASASHDPPYIIKNTNHGELKRKDLVPLNEVNGQRLGEQRKTKYIEAKVLLDGTESVFFYTDGVSEVKNAKGESLGERGFLKVLVNAANSDQEPVNRVSHLKEFLAEYREGHELPDDVTFFMMNYRKSA